MMWLGVVCGVLLCGCGMWSVVVWCGVWSVVVWCGV